MCRSNNSRYDGSDEHREHGYHGTNLFYDSPHWCLTRLGPEQEEEVHGSKDTGIEDSGENREASRPDYIIVVYINARVSTLSVVLKMEILVKSISSQTLGYDCDGHSQLVEHEPGWPVAVRSVPHVLRPERRGADVPQVEAEDNGIHGSEELAGTEVG